MEFWFCMRLLAQPQNTRKAAYSRIKDPKRRASSHSLQKVTVQWDQGQIVGCGTQTFLVVALLHRGTHNFYVYSSTSFRIGSSEFTVCSSGDEEGWKT